MPYPNPPQPPALDPKWASPEGFDNAWYAQVAARDPEFAKRLLALRQQRQESMMQYGNLLERAKAMGMGMMGQTQMPPANPMSQYINPAQIRNPSPSPLVPGWIGVRG